MTICISAISTCEQNGKKEESLVFSTDHMISVGELGQFEKEIKKYKVINNSIIAMLSGQTLLFNRALKDTQSIHEFHLVRDKIQQNLVYMRKDIIKKEIHDLFGIDENYVKELLKGEIKNPFIQNILQTISEFNLKTSILLVGFDEKCEAQICEINESGYSDYRDIHFHAIGSGSIQALNTLLFQNHAKKHDLKTTIYNVYKAKRNAEVANGVGRETEVLILKKGMGLATLTEEQLNILDRIYQEELKFGIKHKDLNNLLT
ncbi:MAG: hypothetical protein PHH54_06780 [Candidatus Nanoarchaeia archaeon]|nr:hypothetical protein [Candidatus Nanoarchaeia archaeon]MDD5741660.1 hypothetical protein [Candidatus Nanoarchaeia archaeon]